MEFLTRNKFREKVESGRLAFGMQLRSGSKRIAEMIAFYGFDFLYLEGEHFVFNDETMEDIFRASQLGGCCPIVRLCDFSPGRVSQVMEAGAKGVIIPHVERAEDAKAFVESIKFPPLGRRSGTKSRFSGYGAIQAGEIRKHENDRTLAIAMIESRKGAENLDAILGTGIDMIRVGFSDLSQDLGYPGEPRNPNVLKTAERIVSIAREHGVTVGTKASTPEEIRFFAGMGFTHFSLGSDISLLSGLFSTLLTQARAIEI